MIGIEFIAGGVGIIEGVFVMAYSTIKSSQEVDRRMQYIGSGIENVNPSILDIMSIDHRKYLNYIKAGAILTALSTLPFLYGLEKILK